MLFSNHFLALALAITSASGMPAEDNHGPHFSSYSGHSGHKSDSHHSHSSHSKTSSRPSGSVHPSHGSLSPYPTIIAAAASLDSEDSLVVIPTPTVEAEHFTGSTFTHVTKTTTGSKGPVARAPKSYSLEPTASLFLKRVSTSAVSAQMYTPLITLSSTTWYHHWPAIIPTPIVRTNSSVEITIQETATSSSSGSSVAFPTTSIPDGNYTDFPTHHPFPTLGIKKGGGAAGFRNGANPDTEPPSYDSLYGDEGSVHSPGAKDPKHTSKGGAKASSTHKPSKPSKTAKPTKKPSSTAKPKTGKPSTGNGNGASTSHDHRELHEENEWDESNDLPFPLGGGLFPIPQDNRHKVLSHPESTHQPPGQVPKNDASKVVVGGMVTMLVLLVHGIF